MGLAHSPSLVTDGLVLCLDAGNPKSYPGSGTAWSDLSGGENNGTIISNPTHITANGGGFSFDGTDDYVDFGNLSNFAFTEGNFSVGCWLKIPSSWTAGSQYPNLVSKGGSAGWDTPGWALWAFRNWGGGNGYSVGFSMRNNNPSAVTNTCSLANNTTDVPMNLVATIDATNVRLYVNSVLRTTITKTINPQTNSNSLIIGRGPTNFYFPGIVYCSSIYSRPLSASEIAQNYAATRGRFGL